MTKLKSTCRSFSLKELLTAVGISAFILIFFLWGIIEPDRETSTSERRTLAQLPALSLGTVLDGSFMSGYEDYSVDQFPVRDAFRRLKAITSFYILNQSDTNGIYLADGHASRLEYPLDYDSVDYAIGRIENIYSSYLKDTDAKVYLCVIPDKNYTLAKENGYPSLDYEELDSILSDRLGSFAEKIDISSLLTPEDYYSTDIHWRIERITDVAALLAEKMDAPFDGSQLSEVKLDTPFYGVYYGQSALPLPADSISYLTSPTIESATAYDYESSREIPIYNMELAVGRDAYDMYLNGTRSHMTIESPNAAGDKELVIFRDSFGSSIAPILLESYSKITLVDIRYLQSSLVGRFVDFDSQDVLFLYSVPVLNNSETMK